MADYFDRFSVLFGKGEVFANGKCFPRGQCSTDILNLDDGMLTELDQRIGDFLSAVLPLFQEKQTAPLPLHRRS